MSEFIRVGPYYWIREKDIENISKYERLINLDICLYKVSNENLSIIFVLFNLKSLKLSGSEFGYYNNPIPKLCLIEIYKLKKLKEFSLDKCLIISNTLTRIHELVELRTLRLACQGALSSDDMKSITRLQNLKTLSLAKLSLPDNAITEISCITSLESLIMVEVSLENQKNLHLVGRLQKLKVLRIELCDIGNGVMDGILNLKKLTTLRIFQKTFNITGNVLNMVCKLKYLKRLDLSTWFIRNTDLECLEKLEKLESLKIGDSFIGKESIILKISKIKNLKKLAISHFDFDDKDAEALSMLKNLETLHLIYSSNIIPILENLHYLESLKEFIFQSHSVPNNLFYCLSKCKKIETIRFYNTFEADFTEIVLLGGLNKLRVLDFYGIKRIDGVPFPPEIVNFQNIEIIKIGERAMYNVIRDETYSDWTEKKKLAIYTRGEEKIPFDSFDDKMLPFITLFW